MLKSKDYLIILLVSIGGASTLTFLTCEPCRSDTNTYWLIASFTSVIWIALWIGNEFINDWLDKRIFWVETPGWRFTAGLVATVAFTVGCVLLLVVIWEKAFGFSFGNYNGVVIPALIVTFLFSLFLHGRQFLLNWKQSAIDAERLQKESVRAQYESLKNQVNPHFLFNSLNALTHLVYEDPDKAAKFIKQLSDVYRYVLDSRDKEVVSLGEELKFLDSYLFLQQIRFGDKLKVIIDLNGTATSVAPLAVQMLIENAIKHNEISEAHPLSIKVYMEGNFIIVENNLQKRTVLEDKSPGLGLENIRKRYDFLSKDKVVVSGEGARFIVKLPLLSFAE
jgi:hypothetical protein